MRSIIVNKLNKFCDARLMPLLLRESPSIFVEGYAVDFRNVTSHRVPVRDGRPV